jgi:hypothetical protein
MGLELLEKLRRNFQSVDDFACGFDFLQLLKDFFWLEVGKILNFESIDEEIELVEKS